jgi:hypothetical protein
MTGWSTVTSAIGFGGGTAGGGAGATGATGSTAASTPSSANAGSAAEDARSSAASRIAPRRVDRAAATWRGDAEDLSSSSTTRAAARTTRRAAGAAPPRADAPEGDASGDARRSAPRGGAHRAARAEAQLTVEAIARGACVSEMRSRESSDPRPETDATRRFVAPSRKVALDPRRAARRRDWRSRRKRARIFVQGNCSVDRVSSCTPKTRGSER